MDSLIRKIAYPLFLLAVTGLLLGLLVHVASLFGAKTLFNLLARYVFLGIFIVFIPAIFAMNRMTREFKQRELWQAALRGCPKWMQKAVWIIFGYSMVGAFVVPFLYGGTPDKGDNNLRSVSAMVLGFYTIAVALWYSVTQVDEFDQSRRCVNGHRMNPLAKFCEECGAPAGRAEPVQLTQ